MIAPADFVHELKSRGYHSFTGVPCSFFQAAINIIVDDPELRYTIVPNEGAALALASGSCLAGSCTAVLIQNSGLGNLVNPLTSLNMIYRVPVLLFVSGRAYGVSDEPQHEVIGRTMSAVLDAMGVAHEDMPTDARVFGQSLDRAVAHMAADGLPYVFFVRKGTIDEYERARVGGPYPLKRIDAIRVIASTLKGDELVIAATGKPSRELFMVDDRAGNFYMQGSMGHAASIGLGVALDHPEKKIVVLDGDGALLMHLGILSTIGHYRPANFYHVVLDNESYESTGDQDTTSSTTDFCRVAEACGYAHAAQVANAASLKCEAQAMIASHGPALLRVKINRLLTEDIPRISSKYGSPQIAKNFKCALKGSRA